MRVFSRAAPDFPGRGCSANFFPPPSAPVPYKCAISQFQSPAWPDVDGYAACNAFAEQMASDDSIDYGAVRTALARMGAVPLELLEDAYRTHVGSDLDRDRIEVFYKTLRKLAQRCDDVEFEAYVTRGESPALVPLSPRELEVLRGAGGSLASAHDRIASFAIAIIAAR